MPNLLVQGFPLQGFLGSPRPAVSKTFHCSAKSRDVQRTESASPATQAAASYWSAKSTTFAQLVGRWRHLLFLFARRAAFATKSPPIQHTTLQMSKCALRATRLACFCDSSTRQYLPRQGQEKKSRADRIWKRPHIGL